MTETLPFEAPSGERRDVVVQGTVRGVRFASADGRFAVLSVERAAAAEEITVIGDVGTLSPGEDARFRGGWEDHAKFGRRFRARGWTPVLPTTVDGLTRFLGSGLIDGIGPALAKRLVARFGARTLDVITEQSVRLREVPGIGKKRAESIAAAVRSRREDAENLTFLHSLGVGPALSRKLLRHYGGRTVEVLTEDPYLVAEEVRGVGFLTADRIGRAAGIAEDDPRRAAGAVLHLVAKAADDGHVFLPHAEVGARAESLGVPSVLAEDAVSALVGREMLVEDGGHLYAPPLHRAEVAAADRIAALVRPKPGRAEAARSLTLPSTLTDAQQAAVRASLMHGLIVLTGGPGTGKTTTLEAIVQAHEGLDLDVTLCAPTGRAAKRMTEASRRDATTIHRLLEWNPAKGSFARTAKDPLQTDLVVVDEASMLDLLLARALLDAIPPHAGLVLVGDVDQLPPVGAGQVLREVIASGAVPVVRLDVVFRQAERSAIVRGAHSILDGRVPTPTPRGQIGDGDLFVVRAAEPEAVIARVVETLRRIPKAYGLDSRRDVQVLAPMRQGTLGIRNLNTVLQDELNPGPATRGFRVHDKVMQLRNDYTREVFNGDLGWVQRVEDGITYVRFDSGLQSYGPDDLDALTLAYASTIHKAQGSEFPAVILVLHGSHHVLLSRALFYTAITRARRLVVLIGAPAAMGRAARRNEERQGYCRLGDRLRGHLEEGGGLFEGA